MGRYRTRTWLRENVPVVGGLFSPGRKDCGDHDWFRADEHTDRCWHCVVGERPHRPVPIDPDSAVWRDLNAAAFAGDSTSRRLVLRMMAEHEDYEALVAQEMQGTVSRLDLDLPHLKEQLANAAAASRALSAAASRESVA